VFGHGTFFRHVAAETRGVRLAVRNLGRRSSHRNAGTPSRLVRVMNPADWGVVGPCALSSCLLQACYWENRCTKPCDILGSDGDLHRVSVSWGCDIASTAIMWRRQDPMKN
jgi:hypothetical protein